MNKVLYICNRKKCENCDPNCNHTADIEFAKNYKTIPSIEEFTKFRQIGTNLFERNEKVIELMARLIEKEAEP